MSGHGVDQKIRAVPDDTRLVADGADSTRVELRVTDEYGAIRPCQIRASRSMFRPLGEVAVAASYLFEELSRQNVLTSNFFLDDKKFMHGIDGKPDPERIRYFRESLVQTRRLARDRQKTSPNDDEALYALTLAADSSFEVCRNHLGCRTSDFSVYPVVRT